MKILGGMSTKTIVCLFLIITAISTASVVSSFIAFKSAPASYNKNEKAVSLSKYVKEKNTAVKSGKDIIEKKAKKVAKSKSNLLNNAKTSIVRKDKDNYKKTSNNTSNNTKKVAKNNDKKTEKKEENKQINNDEPKTNEAKYEGMSIIEFISNQLDNEASVAYSYFNISGGLSSTSTLDSTGFNYAVQLNKEIRDAGYSTNNISYKICRNHQNHNKGYIIYFTLYDISSLNYGDTIPKEVIKYNCDSKSYVTGSASVITRKSGEEYFIIIDDGTFNVNGY